MPKPSQNTLDLPNVVEQKIPPSNATRECGICGGVARRVGELVYHPWRGEKRVCVQWICDNCETGGNVLRDSQTGEVLRLSHVITGTGFEIVGEDKLSVDPEGWSIN